MAFLSFGCSGPVESDVPEKIPDVVELTGKNVPSYSFGEAGIALGMTREEVLTQISLSQSQYDPLRSETESQLFVDHPDPDVIESSTWQLTCPSRNSHVLGGGGGIILRISFLEEKVSAIEALPWLGA